MLERTRTLLLGEKVTPEGFAPEDLPLGITFRRGGLVPRIGGWLARTGGPAAAVTLRYTIVIRPGVRLSRALLAHEMTHVRQWQDDRWFPLRYCLATLRYGYRDNPYEVEARAVAAAASLPSGDLRMS